MGSSFFEDADDLFQLLHQRRLVLQPAGRVDEQDVGAGLARFLEGVECEAGGIGAGVAGDDFGLRALAPDLELVDGCGAEGVAGGEHDILAFGFQLCREFADGCRFAGAIDADDKNDVRLVCSVDGERFGDRREDLLDLGRQDARARRRRRCLFRNGLWRWRR